MRKFYKVLIVAYKHKFALHMITNMHCKHWRTPEKKAYVNNICIINNELNPLKCYIKSNEHHKIFDVLTKMFILLIYLNYLFKKTILLSTPLYLVPSIFINIVYVAKFLLIASYKFIPLLV